MYKKIIYLFIVSIIIFSCKKNETKEEEFDYNKGKISISTDDSFRSIAEAMADAYMINYPETDVKVNVKKEDFGFLDLLNNKTKLVIMSRQLSENEIKEYERLMDLKYQPANFAADALVFVVPKNSYKTDISIDEIKTELLSDKKNMIFDGTNASNLNFIAQKLNKKPSELKFSIIQGNANLIKEISNYQNKIGVVSLNTISRPYGAEAEKLRAMVKILPVRKDNKTFEPTVNNLIQMEYPFTRVLYFLSNEASFGIASGIIRFASTHIGQKVVQKEGLQPYYLYKREVQMR